MQSESAVPLTVYNLRFRKNEGCAAASAPSTSLVRGSIEPYVRDAASIFAREEANSDWLVVYFTVR